MSDRDVRLKMYLAITNPPPCICRVSCHETSIKHKHSSTPTGNTRSGVKNVYFKYESNSYMEIKEFPSYPATKFVTDMGGWLGLFSGLSFLSILEVLLFVLLSVIATL